MDVSLSYCVFQLVFFSPCCGGSAHWELRIGVNSVETPAQPSVLTAMAVHTAFQTSRPPNYSGETPSQQSSRRKWRSVVFA